MKVNNIIFPQIFGILALIIVEHENISYNHEFEVNKKTFEMLTVSEENLKKLSVKKKWEFASGTQKEIGAVSKNYGLKRFSDFLDDAYDGKYSVFEFQKRA
jgi:hypothetical protein